MVKQNVCVFGSREQHSRLVYTSWSETIFMDIISNKFKAGVVFLINNYLQFTLGRFNAPHANTPYFFMIIMGIYSIVLPTNPYFKISRRAYERLLTTCIGNCKNVNLSHSSSHYTVYLYHAPANYKLVVIEGRSNLVILVLRGYTILTRGKRQLYILVTLIKYTTTETPNTKIILIIVRFDLV